MPKLHFLPVHPLMLPGGRPVPEACRPAASWRRRALGNVEWGTVIKPAAFTWTATLDGRQAGGSFQTVLSNLTEIPHWTQNVWNLRDVRRGAGRRAGAEGGGTGREGSRLSRGSQGRGAPGGDAWRQRRRRAASRAAGLQRCRRTVHNSSRGSGAR